MIFFDVTKTGAAGHRSGLMRVSGRLRETLGASAIEVRWDAAAKTFRGAHSAASFDEGDWLLTAELFSEEERPGFSAFLERRPCRLAAIFHDAIPLKHPHITWPQSVARHPGYMKLLARFDRVWAVSHASRDELLGFWRWQGLEREESEVVFSSDDAGRLPTAQSPSSAVMDRRNSQSLPSVDVLALGADFNAAPRQTSVPSGLSARSGQLSAFRPELSTLNSQPSTPPSLLCLGILEPRKNQSFLLDVCHELWTEGLAFALHVVGRVNPHFGAPIVAQLKTLRRTHAQTLQFHEAADDATVTRLYASARATVFPTIAEGCGLPLLESLWMGVPCVCSDLPVLRENAGAGGCLSVTTNDRAAWKAALRRILSDDTFAAQLTTEARTRPLPTWRDAAQALIAALK